MATSPIYNWPEPDNTDLVKNGALAIRTLGNAIDTTMATMVPKSIVDAKGDLIAGTAADTAARLAVGNNGETLVADSSTATGLRYTAGTVQENPVLNSAFQVWQRGTSIACSTTAYTADRWQGYRGVAGATVSRQVTNDTTNLPFIQYAARVQRDSGNTSTSTIYLAQTLETINSIPFVGKTVTLSFYARAGANYSPSSSALGVTLVTGTGTDQNSLTGFTGAAYPINTSATLTTTWQRFTFTATLSASATQIGFNLSSTPVGTAGANDWFEATGVQIDVGSVALPFRTNGATIQQELAACQRYYYRNTSGAAYVNMGIGAATSTTASVMDMQFPVTMRVAPTSIEFSTLRLQDFAAGYAVTTLTIGTNGTGFQMGEMTANVASGLTSGKVYWIGSNNSSTGYIAFSAEL